MRFIKFAFLLFVSIIVFPACHQTRADYTNNKPITTDSSVNKTDTVVTPPKDTTTTPITPPPPPVTYDSKTMVFEVVFESVPTSATATIATLKYNKQGWASVEWDDNSISSLTGFEKLKNTFYTDGCGNNIPYTGAVAVNGRNQYNNEEAGLLSMNVTYNQMTDLINCGWDIENHSYYHEPTGNYNYGNDRNRNVKELEDLIFARINYKMNGLVVPTNYDGFPTAAKNFGYLFSTSQGTFDGLPPAGNPVYKDVQDFALAPVDFSSFNRMFYDNWNEMETAAKKAIDVIITKNNHYFRLASHGIDAAAFSRIIDYFKQKTNDKILMVPTREVMEYRQMAKMPVILELKDGKLTIQVKIHTLADRIRWRDLSFMINSDKKIKSVTALNAIDSVTFNSNTGLINVFKQVHIWQ
ncbi:MAG: hypothetical protein ACK5NK_15135 [Niabella sp.]